MAEIDGQLVPVTVLRRRWFCYRVYVPTKDGKYILRWVAKWKLYPQARKERE